MKNKNALFMIFSVIAIILAVTLFRKFDYDNLDFENNALAGIYIVCLIFSLYVVAKNFPIMKK
jgi:hypothetical protein